LPVHHSSFANPELRKLLEGKGVLEDVTMDADAKHLAGASRVCPGDLAV
jgi:hypothetical protein